MTVRDYFQRVEITQDEILFKGHCEARITSLEKLFEGRCNPYDLVSVKNNFKQLDEEWCRYIDHNHLRYGRQGRSIMVSSLNKYKLTDFIKERFNFTYFGKNRKFMNFEFNAFASMAKMQAAFLLMKYQADLFEIEFDVAISELFINYFNLYVKRFDFDKNENVWLPQPGDLRKCIEVVKDFDMIDLRPYLMKIERYFTLDIAPKVIVIEEPEEQRKPKCKEDLLKLYEEGMSATEFSRTIMNYWNCSERTARRLKKKFGLNINQPDAESEVREEFESSEELSRLSCEIVNLKTIIDDKNRIISEMQMEIENLKSRTVDSSSAQFLINQNLALKAELDKMKLDMLTIRSKYGTI
jgi:hypothetical protein